jgi:hypothetical protein
VHELDAVSLVDGLEGKVTCAGVISPTPTQMLEGIQL